MKSGVVIGVVVVFVLMFFGLVVAQDDDFLADAKSDFEKSKAEAEARFDERSAELDTEFDEYQKKVLIGFGTGFVFIFVLVLVSIIVFIWALIDILRAKNENNWKILWVVVCLFLGIIGAIIYLFVGRKQKK
jgi:cytochrome bd-type quinol oxidase subunit 2